MFQTIFYADLTVPVEEIPVGGISQGVLQIVLDYCEFHAVEHTEEEMNKWKDNFQNIELSIRHKIVAVCFFQFF